MSIFSRLLGRSSEPPPDPEPAAAGNVYVKSAGVEVGGPQASDPDGNNETITIHGNRTETAGAGHEAGGPTVQGGESLPMGEVSFAHETMEPGQPVVLGSVWNGQDGAPPAAPRDLAAEPETAAGVDTFARMGDIKGEAEDAGGGLDHLKVSGYDLSEPDPDQPIIVGSVPDPAGAGSSVFLKSAGAEVGGPQASAPGGEEAYLAVKLENTQAPGAGDGDPFAVKIEHVVPSAGSGDYPLKDVVIGTRDDDGADGRSITGEAGGRDDQVLVAFEHGDQGAPAGEPASSGAAADGAGGGGAVHEVGHWLGDDPADPFIVKVEHVVAAGGSAGSSDSDPIPTETISISFDNLVVKHDEQDEVPTGDDVVVDGRIITGEAPPEEAETVHLYLKSNSEDIQGESGRVLGLQDASGDTAAGDPVARYHLTEAWPSKSEESGALTSDGQNEMSLQDTPGSEESAGWPAKIDMVSLPPETEAPAEGTTEQYFKIELKDAHVGDSEGGPSPAPEGFASGEEADPVKVEIGALKAGASEVLLRKDDGLPDDLAGGPEQAAGDGTTEQFFTISIKEGRVAGEEGGGAGEGSGLTGGERPYPADSFRLEVEETQEAVAAKAAGGDIDAAEPAHAGGTVSQDNWDTSENGEPFVADSFSFGVEREMKESGEKGGTEDSNSGVGELQEEGAGPLAAKEAIHIESFSWGQPSSGAPETPVAAARFGIPVDGVETVDPGDSDGIGLEEVALKGGEKQDYLEVKLENVQITSYSLGGHGAAEGDEPTGPAGADDIGAGADEAEAGRTYEPLTIAKRMDKASPAMIEEEDDDEGSTLEALEVQEPAVIGRAIGSVAAEGSEEGDLDDLDLSEGEDLDV